MKEWSELLKYFVGGQNITRTNRPAIPQSLRHRIYLEAGFACAFPSCNFGDLDIHHIVDWAKVLTHSYDNLIALCPNHHRQASAGKISKQALYLLKSKLQISYGVPVTKVRHGRDWSTCTLDASDVPDYEISLEFPQFHTKSKGLQEINSVIYADMLQMVHLARSEQSFKPEVGSSRGAKSKHKDDYIKNCLFVSHEMWKPARNIISVRFQIYSDMIGSAHPNRSTKTFNYMMKDPAPIFIQDLFDCKSRWLEFLCARCEQAIRKARKVRKADDYFRYPTFDKFKRPFRHEAEVRFDKFVMTADNLVIFFDPYDLASYADGGWAVSIPYQKLIPYLGDKSPLHAMSVRRASESCRTPVAIECRAAHF